MMYIFLRKTGTLRINANMSMHILNEIKFLPELKSNQLLSIFLISDVLMMRNNNEIFFSAKSGERYYHFIY